MERLSGLDAAFLAFETPTMHMHVLAVMVFEPSGVSEGELPAVAYFDQIRDLLSQNVDLVPAFRRRAQRVPLGLNHAVWIEDPSFDLDFHLRRSRLPSPGGPRELASFVAEVASRPLETTKPLWEVHLVEGLESGHFAVVPKLHHSVIDGAAGAELMSAFFEQAPGTRPPEGSTDRTEVQGHLPSEPELFGWGLASLLGHPEKAVEALTRTIGTAHQLMRHNRRLREEDGLRPPPAPFKAPRTSLNGAISAHRRFAFLNLPLRDLQNIKRSFAGTVNDVLLAGVAGALRRLLAERGERLEDSLVAMVPVHLRRDPVPVRGKPVAVQGDVDERSRGVAPNKLSAMLVSLATSVSDPLERLRIIAEGTRIAKEQAGLVPEDLFGGWAQLAFPALSSRVARLAANLRLFDHLPPLFNVVVSNIHGPDIPLSLAGSRLVGMYPAGPIIEGVGLNITAMSYSGELFIGLLACRELVPEVEHLGHLLSDSFGELAKAALRNGGHWA
jgi:diacylglycerol O-acyltransferase / wax synthase